MTGITNINIEPAIVIYVNKHNAGTPHTILNNSRRRRDILKFEIAFVEVDLIIPHIGSKKNVGKAIIVQVTYSNSSSIIKVPKKKTVFKFTVRNAVIEINPRIIYQLK